MLTGRLIRVVRDILEEYSEFGVAEHLQTASSIAASRGQMDDDTYRKRRQELMNWAQNILEETKIGKYPDDLRSFIERSDYFSALPGQVAKVVLGSFPDDKNLAISSSEINIYLQLVTRARQELAAIDAAARKLNIEEIIIPPDEISLDVMLPRNVFSDRADIFADILTRFVRIASYFIELSTGSEDSPKFAYSSTSDPVTGIALVVGAAWGFLKFYKLALEVAEKQISFLKTLKDLKALPVTSSPNLEQQIKSVLAESLNKAVEGAVAATVAKVPESRKNEIIVAIKKDAHVVVQAIANGARVAITVESLDKVPSIAESLPDVTTEKVNQALSEQKALEFRVTQSREILGEAAPLLISSESSVTPRVGEATTGSP